MAEEKKWGRGWNYVKVLIFRTLEENLQTQTSVEEVLSELRGGVPRG